LRLSMLLAIIVCRTSRSSRLDFHRAHHGAGAGCVLACAACWNSGFATSDVAVSRRIGSQGQRAKFRWRSATSSITPRQRPSSPVLDVPKHRSGLQLYYLSTSPSSCPPAVSSTTYDQGIIAPSKARYRRHLVRVALAALEEGRHSPSPKNQITSRVLSGCALVCRGGRTSRNCWFKADILGTDRVPTPPPAAVGGTIAAWPCCLAPQPWSAPDADDDDGVVEVDGGQTAWRRCQTDLEQLARCCTAPLEAWETGTPSSGGLRPPSWEGGDL
jgi:hypothetical protein